MKIDKLFNGLKRIANGDYVLEGDLISEETIEIDLDDRFVVKGKIRAKKSIVVRRGIEAGWGIKAGCGIEAGDGIKAGWGIKAGDGIKAGCGIKAGDGIEAGWGIEAGCGIKAGCGIEAGWGIEAEKFIDVKNRIFAGISVYRTSQNCDKTIRCAELRSGEICYGDLTITENGGSPDES